MKSNIDRAWLDSGQPYSISSYSILYRSIALILQLIKDHLFFAFFIDFFTLIINICHMFFLVICDFFCTNIFHPEFVHLAQEIIIRTILFFLI